MLPPMPFSTFSRLLLAVAFLLLALMALGAATRLTGSGLSMTSWQAVAELPPLDAQQWQETFDEYLRSPEGQGVNRDISLQDFRRIFWWEWSHRSLARCIAFFLLTMLVLEAAHKNKERSLFVLSLLCLVAFQGVLGWVMVRSGLRDVAMVSPYLLTLHLFLALVLVLVVVHRSLARCIAFFSSYDARFGSGAQEQGA